MASRITRSLGIAVPGWFGPRPGGGVTGATEELDRTVAQAAEALAEALGRDVEIRFNSDRLSGGAYFGDGLAEVGVGADSRDGVVRVDVYAGLDRLRDEPLARRGSFWHHYVIVPAASVPAAVAWLEVNCDFDKPPRVSAAEAKRWQERRVSCLSDDGDRREVSFARAVGHFGQQVASDVDAPSTETGLATYLVSERRMTERAALDVARAVFRVLSRGWSACWRGA